MKQRVVWPIAAVVALGVVVLGVSSLAAQREGDRERRPGVIMAAPGRFVVAHALAERIVILDTATGQLYVATERDMKRHSEMPRPIGPDDRIRGFRDEMKRDEFKRDGRRDKDARKEGKRDRDERKEKKDKDDR